MSTLLPSSRIQSNRRWFVLAGLVLMCASLRAEEKQNNLLTSLSSTTISGYVDSSATWNPGVANSVPEPASGTFLFAGAAAVALFNGARRRSGFAIVSSRNPEQ
jgi:hypothetical protein